MEEVMPDPKANCDIVHPTLHHFGLTTANLDAMVDWYGKVLCMRPIHLTSRPAGSRSPRGMRVAWLSNDDANHRIAILALPGLTCDSGRRLHRRLQHVAFEYPSVDDLLAAYARLKALGIEPVLTADHGATTAFYYEDPDGNSVELAADNFGDWKQSTEYLRTSADFAANPMGALVDPDAMIAARTAGVSIEEVHRRAYAGEFPPSKFMNPGVLL
jgi:catechol 2,3-dioxygenase-like lactoylglutathione lyase family enzyme